ncbi:MAG: hypothetical protein CR994_03975 [Maribacter sp.]|nr:MAG: hypothetical protein CR994_03975 [Maribacter sp.]
MLDLHSQTNFSYRIINENVFTYNVISESSAINPDNLLQLNELEIVNRFFPIGTFIKKQIKLQVEPKIFLSPLDETLDFDLNELYVQYGISEKFYVTFGKKRINWGTANVWNPSNPFFQKDPFRLDNRLEGVVLTDLEYISKKFTLNALFSPEKKLNKSAFAIRFSSEIKSFSYSLGYAFLGDEKQQFSGDFSLGTSNFTFYGEGVLRNFSNTNLINPDGIAQIVPTRNDFKNMNSEFVLGTMLNILPRTILTSEYRYRSDFNSFKSIENFKTFLPENLSQYDPISMGRHSFFGQISYMDPYSKYNVNTSVFYDLITNQLLCSPGLIYNGDDFKLEINPFVYNNSLSIYDFQGRVILSFFL